jgi:hypothetical protein
MTITTQNLINLAPRIVERHGTRIVIAMVVATFTIEAIRCDLQRMPTWKAHRATPLCSESKIFALQFLKPFSLLDDEIENETKETLVDPK